MISLKDLPAPIHSRPIVPPPEGPRFKNIWGGGDWPKVISHTFQVTGPFFIPFFLFARFLFLFCFSLLHYTMFGNRLQRLVTQQRVGRQVLGSLKHMKPVRMVSTSSTVKQATPTETITPTSGKNLACYKKKVETTQLD